MSSSRFRDIEEVLHRLEARIADVEGLSVMTKDGLPVASALPDRMEEDRIGAMSAAMLSLGERVVQELERGNIKQVIIEGDNGLVLIIEAGPHAVLAGVCRANAKLGLVLLDMRRAAARLSELV